MGSMDRLQRHMKQANPMSKNGDVLNMFYPFDSRLCCVLLIFWKEVPLSAGKVVQFLLLIHTIPHTPFCIKPCKVTFFFWPCQNKETPITCCTKLWDVYYLKLHHIVLFTSSSVAT